MKFKIKHLILPVLFIGLEILSCKPSAHNNVPVIQTDTTLQDIELPADVDTTIPTNHIAEFLDKKYALDPVQQLELPTEAQVEENDSVRTSAIHLKDISIEYTYTYFKKADSGSTEIKVNGVKRTFVDEDGKPAQDYGDLNLNLGVTIYTIAGEKYILISCSPIDAVGWLSKVAYGMLIKISDSNTVMQLGTYYYPGDPYLTGDFYIRQDRFTGKVFYLIVKPATFDNDGNPDNIFIKVKELQLK